MAHEDIRQKLLPRFRETTADRVDKISAALLTLERASGDGESREELVRELHTLKGEARMMGFAGISTVVHAAEELLRSMPEAVTDEALEALLKASDAIVPLLDAPLDGGEAAQAVGERLRALISRPEAPVVVTSDTRCGAADEANTVAVPLGPVM